MYDGSVLCADAKSKQGKFTLRETYIYIEGVDTCSLLENIRQPSPLSHRRYGGRIYGFDFNGYTSMSDVADRMKTDMRFDRYCMKNLEYRELVMKTYNEEAEERGWS